MRSQLPIGEAQVSLFATGSEVSLAVEAKKLLDGTQSSPRVVSVPCFELFRSLNPRATAGRCVGAAPVRSRHRSGNPPGLGRNHRLRRRLRRHDRLWRQRPGRGALFKHFGITARSGRPKRGFEQTRQGVNSA